MAMFMGMIRRHLVVLLLPVACADPPRIEIAFDAALCSDDARGGFAVRDSGGIEIVENGAPTRGARVRVSQAPVVTIGVTEGQDAYLFGRIVGATRLPDGRIVIADGQSLDLRVFDPEGDFLNRSGGKGEGPGEHQSIDRIFRQGDTLIVLDNRVGRLTRVLPDGTVVEVLPIEWIPFSYVLNGRTTSGRSLPGVRGVFADGSILATQRIQSGPAQIETRISRSELTLRRIDLRTGAAQSVGLFRATEDFIYLHPDGSFTFGDAPFGKPGLLAITGDRFYAGDGEGFEIEEHTSDGTLTRIIRVCELPDPVTEREYEAYVQDLIEPLEGLGRELEEIAHRGLPRPEFAAPYMALHVDPTGRIWVRDFTFVGMPQRWRVLDRDGRWLSDVTLPADVDVLEVGDDYVLGRVRDEFDVERVEIYEVSVDS